MFDSLLAGSLDETGAGYGLLAEDVVAAPTVCRSHSDCAPVLVSQRHPVLAADVKHSLPRWIAAHLARVQDHLARCRRWA
jgi:microcin C transport system substrate-binding protein